MAGGGIGDPPIQTQATKIARGGRGRAKGRGGSTARQETTMRGGRGGRGRGRGGASPDATNLRTDSSLQQESVDSKQQSYDSAKSGRSSKKQKQANTSVNVVIQNDEKSKGKKGKQSDLKSTKEEQHTPISQL